MTVKAKATKPEAAAPDNIQLELASYTRYNRTGTLYEKGVVYDVEAEFAGELLKDKTDFGMPIFMRHTPKKDVAKKIAEEIAAGKRPVKVKSPAKDKQALPETDSAKITKIEIGTPEEEAELFAAADGAPEGTEL